MPNINPIQYFIVISLLALAVACQTNETGESQYNVFFSPADHMEDLLKEQSFAQALTVYEDQVSYFTDPKNAKESDPVLRRLYQHYSHQVASPASMHTARLNAIDWPASVSDWPRIKEILDRARTFVKNAPKSPLFKTAAYRLKALESLRSNMEEKVAVIRGSADAMFAEYALASDTPFFDVYPVEVDNTAILAAGIQARKAEIIALPRRNLQGFANAYLPYMDDLPKDMVGLVENALAERILADERARLGPGLPAAMSALNTLAGMNIHSSSIPSLRFGLIDATSSTLANNGYLDFLTDVEIDLPVRTTATELLNVLDDDDAPDYLIVLDVTLAKASRKVRDVESHRSTYLAGYEKVKNRDYKVAELNLQTAQINLQGAQSASNSASFQAGLAGAFSQLAAAIRIEEMEEAYNEAVATMANTPEFIDEPVYENYSYRTAKILGEKTMTVNYYVIDRSRSTYYESIFDVVEKESFRVGYGVLDEDPNREERLENLTTEEDVASWEEANSTIALSSLLAHYLENSGEERQFESARAFLNDLEAERNRVATAYKAENFEERSLDDPRFDSVVKIHTARSLGSGFFVRPDVVMTNWHVVDQSEFVELTHYDGTESFGKVIVSDARLDLALVKVQTRGVPVEFYEDRSLSPGSPVAAIGHPKGFEFSISRGIVSAIRRHRNINGVGGKKVLFVQTDAEINPGNSGGPLFKENKVIGVNTWGRGIGTGLNFAVHYSEVLKFIEGSLDRSS